MSRRMMREHVEWDRRESRRCPRCGSDNWTPFDYQRGGPDGDEYPVGDDCDDCGFVYSGWPGDDYWDRERPFIYPGEPGSYDTPTDAHFRNEQ